MSTSLSPLERGQGVCHGIVVASQPPGKGAGEYHVNSFSFFHTVLCAVWFCACYYPASPDCFVVPPRNDGGNTPSLRLRGVARHEAKQEAIRSKYTKSLIITVRTNYAQKIPEPNRAPGFSLR
jgi:hypothetical protein